MGRNVSRTLSRSTRDVPEWMFWINQRGAVYKDEEKSRKPVSVAVYSCRFELRSIAGFGFGRTTRI